VEFIMEKGMLHFLLEIDKIINCDCFHAIEEVLNNTFSDVIFVSRNFSCIRHEGFILLLSTDRCLLPQFLELWQELVFCDAFSLRTTYYTRGIT